MKKITLFAVVLLATVLVNSCNKENNASSTLNYAGVCKTIHYSDTLNVRWNNLVKESFDLLGYTGARSIFQETATVDVGSIDYAQYMCHVQARKTYTTKLNSLILSQVKSSIFNTHTDSIIGLGYPRADSIPLKQFSAVFYLFSSANTIIPIDSFVISVK